jgi:hypothetical protein
MGAELAFELNRLDPGLRTAINACAAGERAAADQEDVAATLLRLRVQLEALARECRPLQKHLH